MHRPLTSAALVSALLLGGCSTLSGNKPVTKPSTVCSKVVPPAEVPLSVFTFVPLPSGTSGEGGMALVAGLTADSVAAILGNHVTLKRREAGWQNRADAINNCLEAEAKSRGAKNGSK